MPNKILKTYKKEFKKSNCGFDHDPVEAMVRSQWQSRSKSNAYLAYRWIVAVFVVVVVITSMCTHITSFGKFGLWFIYLTHWGIMINMITGVYGAILVTAWHFHSDFQDKIVKTPEMPLAFKIYWAIHNTALITSFVVTIIYWAILHNDTLPVDATNILSHALNSAIMFVDILIVAYPLRLYHVIQPICFGVVYGIFSFIYFLCDGVNTNGKPFIYNVLYWGQPKKAFVTVIGTLTLAIIVHLVLFSVYKVRVFVQRRFFNNDLILPITASNSKSANASQISMVFGDKGHTNEAFSNSSEKIQSK